MNRYSIVEADYGDEDKIFMVFEVWDNTANTVVSAHTSRKAAAMWINQHGGQVENRELELACL